MKGASYTRPGQSHKKRKRYPSPERVSRRQTDVEHAGSTRQRNRDRVMSAHSKLPIACRDPRLDKDIQGGRLPTELMRHSEGTHLDSPSLGCHGNVVGRSLRLPSAGPSNNKLASSHSVDEFLHSIKLDNADHRAHESDRPQAPGALAPSPNPPLHTSPKGDAQDAISVTPGAPGHQVHLAYRGHSLSIDLSLLPDDPAGPIVLLSKTQSDPGAYLLIGAHYRRTGRPKSASSILRALLDKADRAVEHVKENVAASLDTQRPAFVTATMRPVMLMLAACELDISRESLSASDRSSHASAAHDLFRVVYGSANEATRPSAEEPQIRNALGLDFSSNRGRSASALDEFVSAPFVALERNHLEGSGQELRGTLEMQNSLPDTLHALKDQCKYLMVRLRALETGNREDPVQICPPGAEERVTEPESAAPVAETSALVRLKEMLSELDGGTRGG
ncbi:hypothetical protein F5I97DRAFT_1924960 [Phlebopus sp. FC_14]|nr:hypothetical protein F5I97DRAFT_1924960 [Phlebopus sp. FC_14]